MLWPLIVIAFAAGAAGGAWACHRLQPWLQAWRERPRVSGRERRQRLARSRASAALEAAYAGQAREASWWARRALRVDPRHPLGLLAMGYACKQQERYMEAAAYLERALREIRVRDGAGVPEHFVAEASSELAAAYALAAGCVENPQQRDAHHQKALQWFRYALDEEPELQETLRRDPAFSGMRQEVESLLGNRIRFQVTT